MNHELVFKALADQSRRILLDKLFANNGQNLNSLCEHLQMSRQAVMKHLRILEQAKLITIYWYGREKLHYLNPVPIQQTLGRWIKKYEQNRVAVLSDLKNHLEQDQQLVKKRKAK